MEDGSGIEIELSLFLQNKWSRDSHNQSGALSEKKESNILLYKTTRIINVLI